MKANKCSAEEMPLNAAVELNAAIDKVSSHFMGVGASVDAFGNGFWTAKGGKRMYVVDTDTTSNEYYAPQPRSVDEYRNAFPIGSSFVHLSEVKPEVESVPIPDDVTVFLFGGLVHRGITHRTAGDLDIIALSRNTDAARLYGERLDRAVPQVRISVEIPVLASGRVD